MGLNIEYKKTSNLTPYANNSRTHDERQVDQICNSITEFGFTNPILIDEDDGIIAGHGRLQAAEKLGLDEVPTIRLEGLTDVQKRAYVIADNQIGLNSSWDYDTLKLELDALTELEFDLDLLALDDLNTFASDTGLDDFFEEPPKDKVDDGLIDLKVKVSASDHATLSEYAKKNGLTYAEMLFNYVGQGNGH